MASTDEMVPEYPLDFALTYLRVHSVLSDTTNPRQGNGVPDGWQGCGRQEPHICSSRLGLAVHRPITKRSYVAQSRLR